MKKELDDKLCKDFPKIFAQRGLSMTETCMCWGFECDDGWYTLIYDLCKNIQKHCDNNNFQVEATQVKEKFGTLRFYVQGADCHVHDLIDEAEYESGITCEKCGAPASSGPASSEIRGWLSTLCPTCRQNLEAASQDGPQDGPSTGTIGNTTPPDSRASQ